MSHTPHLIYPKHVCQIIVSSHSSFWPPQVSFCKYFPPPAPLTYKTEYVFLRRKILFLSETWNEHLCIDHIFSRVTKSLKLEWNLFWEGTAPHYVLQYNKFHLLDATVILTAITQQQLKIVFCCDCGDESTCANAERWMPFCHTQPAMGQAARQDFPLFQWMGSYDLSLGSLTNIPFLTISTLSWTFTNWGRLEFS